MTRKPSPSGPPPRVVAVVYDGLCTFEFGCVVEVFGLPRPEFERPLYRFATAAAEPGPLRAAGGLRVEADGGLELLTAADIIVVPGWRDIERPPPRKLVAELQAAIARGARVASICSGSALLAHAGLLEGRRATTHWRYAEAFRTLFPDLRIEEDVLYVDEGQVLTSAGSAAGLDLCLHLVRRDYGIEIANQVARRLVIPPHRDGGQAQFVARPVSPPDRDQRLAPLLDRLRADPARAYDMADLAAMAGISQRSLLRRFREATGASPHAWLTRMRIRHAQDLLESTGLSIEQIATASGFGSAESLRHHFRRQIRTSPNQYRKAFAGTTQAAPG